MPSVYFLYTIYKKEAVKKDIEAFVLTPIKKHGNEILKWEIFSRDTIRQIKAYHSRHATKRQPETFYRQRVA
jgi:hypothetical protein